MTRTIQWWPRDDTDKDTHKDKYKDKDKDIQEESLPIYIKPSQMEVAPLHRTFVISHKRRLFKNTKGI